ncbi:hypothetical protein WG66_009647 [Moniliophthora roreri]|nr:hypothetical protein WG66_009647 [Moniliophthora roreri]
MSLLNAQPTETIMQSNNPLQLCGQLDILAAKSSKKKLVELVTSWVNKLISDNSAYTIDSVPYHPFYKALEEFLKDIENPSLSRGLIGAFTRLASANASKVKKAYKILQLTRPPSSKVNIALTAAEHTSMVLVAVGEEMDFGPLKVVATVVAKIIELAKTAKGNKDEALRLGEHVKGMMNELKESLNGTENLPPEESAVIGRSIQPLQALDDIAVMLQQLQKSTSNHFTEVFSAKDMKDELGQLQRKLDDAFCTFLANNNLALHIRNPFV